MQTWLLHTLLKTSLVPPSLNPLSFNYLLKSKFYKSSPVLADIPRNSRMKFIHHGSWQQKEETWLMSERKSKLQSAWPVTCCLSRPVTAVIVLLTLQRDGTAALQAPLPLQALDLKPPFSRSLLWIPPFEFIASVVCTKIPSLIMMGNCVLVVSYT